MYNLEFDLNKNDFINLGRDLLCIPRFRNQYLFSLIFCILILYALNLLFFKDLTLFLEISAFSIFIYLYIIMMQSGNAMYKAAKELGLHRKFEFKDQDFIGLHDGCTSTYAYTSIKELYETKNSIIMCLSKQLILFIPKRIIQNVKIYDFLKQKTGL